MIDGVSVDEAIKTMTRRDYLLMKQKVTHLSLKLKMLLNLSKQEHIRGGILDKIIF